MANAGTFLQSMRRETVDFPPDPIVAMDWLQARYQEVLERAPYSFLLKEEVVTTTAEITAGTVTITLGSTTVTESTSNANGWTSAIVGRNFRLTGEDSLRYYDIDAFGDNNPDTITLNRAMETPTGTLKTYEIFQRIYSLASDVRDVISMQELVTGRQLVRVSQSELDRAYPERPILRESPDFYAPAGVDSSGNWQVEFYPVPNRARGIIYRYLQKTPTLADGDAVILPQVDYRLLRSGWLADYWSWRAARQDAPPNSIVMSQKYEAEFEKRLLEMVNREAGMIGQQQLALPPRVFKHRHRSKWDNRRIESL